MPNINKYAKIIIKHALLSTKWAIQKCILLGNSTFTSHCILTV